VGKLFELKLPNSKIVAYAGKTSPFTGWKYLVFDSWRDLFKMK